MPTIHNPFQIVTRHLVEREGVDRHKLDMAIHELTPIRGRMSENEQHVATQARATAIGVVTGAALFCESPKALREAALKCRDENTPLVRPVERRMFAHYYDQEVYDAVEVIFALRS